MNVVGHKVDIYKGCKVDCPFPSDHDVGHHSHSIAFSEDKLPFDKDEANYHLRLGIKLLKGLGCTQTFERAISDVISIRDNLKASGAWWQYKRLDNWIHRAQSKGGFL